MNCYYNSFVFSSFVFSSKLLADSIDFISTCNIFGLALWYLWLVILVMNRINDADHTLELSGEASLFQERENAAPLRKVKENAYYVVT